MAKKAKPADVTPTEPTMAPTEALPKITEPFADTPYA
jgi:hypothetical protein